MKNLYNDEIKDDFKSSFSLKKSSLICFVILQTLLVAPDTYFFIKSEQYDFAIFAFLTGLSLIFLPLYVFRNYLKIYCFLLLPFFILLPINVISIFIFNVPIDETSLILILNTNAHESFELIKGYLLSFAIFLILYGFCIFYLFSCVPKKITLITSKYFSVISLSILLLLPLLDRDTSKQSYFTKFKGRFYTVYPTSFLYACKEIYDQYVLVNSFKDIREKYLFHAKPDTSITSKQLHVLIIGESSRFDHWGINGYSRNTSPMLAKRNNLISFTNASSGGYITELAVPLLLTGVGATHFNDHFKQKSIIGAFNEAGFTSYWISNQIDEGHIKIHSLEANKRYEALSDYRATKNINLDMQLTDTLKKILVEPGNKKFIVIHTSGSHYDYSVRYPDNFDVFKPSNKTIFSKPTDKHFKNVLVNSYDNSIVYSDAVIDSVISMVAAQNAYASVSYISDHGDNLFDDERNLSQHSSIPISKYIIHIPYFIWYSPILENKSPDKIKNLKRYINAKTSSQSLIYTLTSLGGITYSGQDSLFNMTTPYFKIYNRVFLGPNKKISTFKNLQ